MVKIDEKNDHSIFIWIFSERPVSEMTLYIAP